MKAEEFRINFKEYSIFIELLRDTGAQQVESTFLITNKLRNILCFRDSFVGIFGYLKLGMSRLRTLKFWNMSLSQIPKGRELQLISIPIQFWIYSLFPIRQLTRKYTEAVHSNMYIDRFTIQIVIYSATDIHNYQKVPEHYVNSF